jgi:NAD-dependent dihydropyrimidine dehydrogenase PreA subunit
MCRFCVQHGDGKRWYGNARNYAMDLESDLVRRGYMVGFASKFEKKRGVIDAGLRALRFVPRPAKDWLAQRASAAFLKNHFGQPVPIEECGRIFDIATHITRLPCVCRGAMKPASSAESCCIVMTVQPHDSLVREIYRDYAGGPQAEGFETLTKEQALAYLRRAEERGLCHTAWTFITPFIAALCNCDLPSGCMAMRIQLLGGVRMMWKGEDVAVHREDLCTNCRQCVGRCPFGAIRPGAGNGGIAIDRLSCWGCGVCRSACREGALALEPRAATRDVAEVW